MESIRSAASTTDFQQPSRPAELGRRLQSSTEGDDKLQEAFTDFVGQTFYGQLLGAMRKTVGKPAYFHGGRAEEVFQKQLDQVLSEYMTEASADSFAKPMFELFQLHQR